MFENIKITNVLYSDKINEIKTFKPRNRDEYLKLLNAHFNLKIVPDFPIKVSLETSSLCNYNCPMCPREHMTRPKQNMPFDMAKKAIDECKRNGVYYMAFQRHGEPLMNPHVIGILKYAYTAGIPVRTIITNGALLTATMSEKLLCEAKPSSIVVSFDGVTKEEYSILRNCDKYEEVKNNILTLYELKKEMGSDVFLQINALTLNVKNDSIKKFRKEFEFLDNVAVEVPERIGGTESEIFNKSINSKSKIPTAPCKQLWMHLILLSNGEVSMCCPDVNCDVKAGDFNKNTLKEIWNTKSANYFRQKHIFGKRNEIPICAKCQNECIALGYY